jgi:hypothetical protein
MSNDRTWTRRAALGLIAGGGGLLAFSTDAATQIHLNRGTDLGTEDDEAALLPLIDKSGDASISDSDEEATVYSIDSNNLGWKFTSVKISEVGGKSGDKIGTNDIVAVEKNGRDAAISCTGSGFSGEYEITLDIKADAAGGDVSATMQRTTHAISIDCPIDYNDQNNYSDNEDGTAKRPGNDAKGEVINPENVNEGNSGSTTLQSRNNDGGLKVGFTLPTVPSAGEYTLKIKVKKSTAGLYAYLVDGDGNPMSCKKSLKKGLNEFDIDDSNSCINSNDTISDNRTDLFLIFEDTSNGNNSSQIKFFELSAA